MSQRSTRFVSDSVHAEEEYEGLAAVATQSIWQTHGRGLFDILGIKSVILKEGWARAPGKR